MSEQFLKFSSVTKKIWMSLLGIFLMIFLVVHLTINLFLLRNDGGEWFNEAAHFMGTNYVVKIFEVVLFLGFILHIILGIILQLQNWMSRPMRYNVSNRSKTPFLSKYMIYTGGIVLVFLILHFFNFYFIKLGWVSNPNMTPEGEANFFLIARELFSQPLYVVVYIGLFVVLGFHLYHAFESAFQSLGLNHKTYTPSIELGAKIYSVIIPMGFILIPIHFLIFS
jgi:succinate dehydrogenase / fumarate reductase, cytochrome b subunit